MHLKVFLKLKKTLKPSLLGKKKTKKKPQKTKKPTGLVFFEKKPGFFQPWLYLLAIVLNVYLVYIIKISENYGDVNKNSFWYINVNVP
jgi:hypothetical protein